MENSNQIILEKLFCFLKTAKNKYKKTDFAIYFQFFYN